MPYKVVGDGCHDFLNAVVFASCKRNAYASIAAEKENHAALDVACVFSREVSFARNFAGYNERANEE